MANCLVLGANGFIGSHIVDELIASGHKVRAFDRFTSDFRNFNEHDQVEIVAGDFLNRDDRLKALDSTDYVFHFISFTTPITADNDPIIDIDTNIREGIEFFRDCVEKKIKKIIFASTGGAIYGSKPPDQTLDETTLPEPISPYAIGKLTVEHYLRYFNAKFGLKSVTYRISNPYGDRQSPAAKQGVIPIFLNHIKNGQSITVYGDGSMVRDYIYIKDVAEMIASSFQSETEAVYNLGSGKGVSLNELIAEIKTIVKKDFTVEYADKPTTFVERVVLNCDKFNGQFNIRPKTDLHTGIEQTWHYINGLPVPNNG